MLNYAEYPKLQENRHLTLNVSASFLKLAKMSKLSHWSHIYPTKEVKFNQNAMFSKTLPKRHNQRNVDCNASRTTERFNSNATVNLKQRFHNHKSYAT